MTITDRVSKDIINAYKSGDVKGKSGLSLVKNELAKARKDKGTDLNEAEEIKVVQKQIQEQRETRQYLAERYAGSAPELADVDRLIELYEAYLPAQMDEAQLITAIKTIADGVAPGNVGQRVGAVMKELKARYDGSYDPKQAGTIVKKVIAE